MRALMVSIIESAAAMREPSHDEAVGPDDLQPVDAEVLPPLGRPASHSESPRDERPGISGPARLDRKAGKIDVLRFPYDVLERRRRTLFRRHVHHLAEERKFLP